MIIKSIEQHNNQTKTIFQLINHRHIYRDVAGLWQIYGHKLISLTCRVERSEIQHCNPRHQNHQQATQNRERYNIESRNK